LGYAIPHKAVREKCKGVLKQNILTEGGNQEMLFITEGDLYRLIVNSKLPTADNEVTMFNIGLKVGNDSLGRHQQMMR